MSFLSYLVNGLSLGSVYAIIALGYTMVYGIAKMLNFAHGDVIMIGGFVVFSCMSNLGLNGLLSVIALIESSPPKSCRFGRFTIGENIFASAPKIRSAIFWRK